MVLLVKLIGISIGRSAIVIHILNPDGYGYMRAGILPIPNLMFPSVLGAVVFLQKPIVIK